MIDRVLNTPVSTSARLCAFVNFRKVFMGFDITAEAEFCLNTLQCLILREGGGNIYGAEVFPQLSMKMGWWGGVGVHVNDIVEL